jgi:SIT family siderophore-iron:H+ symporter-like MFS transporter
MLGTVSTIRSIVACAIQPAYAKVSDVFGRITILIFCTVLYVIGKLCQPVCYKGLILIFYVIAGTIVEATSHSVAGFAGGAILYQFGYTGIILLVEILIADTTTLRNRLFFSYVPALREFDPAPDPLEGAGA